MWRSEDSFWESAVRPGGKHIHPLSHFASPLFEYLFILDSVSLHAPGWLGTLCVDQADLELTEICLPLPLLPKCWEWPAVIFFFFVRKSSLGIPVLYNHEKGQSLGKG